MYCLLQRKIPEKKEEEEEKRVIEQNSQKRNV
jgi:hypothetical protein